MALTVDWTGRKENAWRLYLCITRPFSPWSRQENLSHGGGCAQIWRLMGSHRVTITRWDKLAARARQGPSSINASAKKVYSWSGILQQYYSRATLHPCQWKGERPDVLKDWHVKSRGEVQYYPGILSTKYHLDLAHGSRLAASYQAPFFWHPCKFSMAVTKN